MSQAHYHNIASSVVPRCSSSDSLNLSENCSGELCSECRITEWVPDGPGMGRGCPSSSSSSSSPSLWASWKHGGWYAASSWRDASVYRCGFDDWSILRSWQYVIFPSGKATLSRFTLDQIQVNNTAKHCCAVEGPSLTSLLCYSTLLRTSATLRLNSETSGKPGNLGRELGGSGTLWSSSGGDGGFTGVVVPEVVTPVTIEPLLGVWTIKSSSIW